MSRLLVQGQGRTSKKHGVTVYAKIYKKIGKS